MRNIWTYIIWGISLVILTLSTAFAQTDKLKNTSKIRSADSVLAKYKESVFQFKNINKIAYYDNPDVLKQINKSLQKKQWQKAYNLLYEYVGNFGVENFYKDTYLIWRLAKLMELLDDPEAAKSLYRLVLKHHRGGDIKKIEIYYDSININDKDYYVPLDYYYELVNYRKLIDTLIPPKGVLLDMGPRINTEFADYGPTLNITDDMLLFTSKRNSKTVNFKKVINEDIFFSKRVDSTWDNAEELKGINTQYNEGSARITKDGKTLYFSRCQSPEGYGDCDIYVGTLQPDGSWGNIHNLGANVNGVGWDSHPALSHTEDTLYFASDRIGGFGLTDIYFTFKTKEGNWARAQNMGPIINTRKSEVSPFYHPKFDILYFSSTGHLVNFGDFDIYKSYKIYGRWQEPKNIGPLVNGKGSEYYFTIDSDSRELFYAHSEEEDVKNLELQSFPLPMEAQPTATAIFKGLVTDSISGNPFTGIVSVIDLDNGIEIAPKYLRPDGSYEFDLIKDNNYLLIITGDDFFRIEQQFLLKQDTTMNFSTPSLKFRKWKFASLEFEEGSAQILKEMAYDLNKLVYFLADHPNIKLKIAGHTDSNGNAEANLTLSQKRADAIKAYLIEQGAFSNDRIEAMGYGSKYPVVPELTAEDRKINRRVEFEILKY